MAIAPDLALPLEIFQSLAPVYILEKNAGGDATVRPLPRFGVDRYQRWLASMLAMCALLSGPAHRTLYHARFRSLRRRHLIVGKEKDCRAQTPARVRLHPRVPATIAGCRIEWLIAESAEGFRHQATYSRSPCSMGTFIAGSPSSHVLQREFLRDAGA